jgi:mitogen-activated protein kinase kinase kinase
MDTVLSWLVSNHFSKDWQETFKTLNICGLVFLDLGNDDDGTPNLDMMNSQIYPRLARECTSSGTGWDQAREREEGKRMHLLIKRIMAGSPAERPVPEASHSGTDSFEKAAAVPMNFGFSIGDFFVVGQLAWNVYKSCT